MRAKLIKRDDDFYSLKLDGIVMATSNGILVDYNLSKQNCDEIFGIIDVELMADFYGASVKGSLDFKFGANKGFEEGFNKAMELNKDKVFTLEDIEEAFAYGQLNQVHNQKYFSGSKTYIQSLQQPTEIEVEIEMEEVIIGQCDCECHSNTSIMHFMACCNPKIFTEPKIDENGCLILKRIKE